MKIRYLIAFCMVFLVSANAYACTRPTGRFVGTGSGLAVNGDNGSTLAVAAFTMTVNINNNGTGTIVEQGKSTLSANVNFKYNTTNSFTSTFNTTTCTGQVFYQGRLYIFSSSGKGTRMTFTDFSNDNTFVLYNLVLEKV